MEPPDFMIVPYRPSRALTDIIYTVIRLYDKTIRADVFALQALRDFERE